jgi:hypothetical protein
LYNLGYTCITWFDTVYAFHQMPQPGYIV